MLSSVIVMARNHLDDLTRTCIDSVLNNTGVPYELICIDDGSTDGTLEFFKSVADKWRSYPTSQGVSSGRSWGMAVSKGDVIVFLDNDCIVPPGWLRGILKTYKRGIGVVGPCLSNEKDRIDRMPRSPDGLITVQSVSGACMAFTREVFRKLGYLKPELVNQGEDTDYCYRALFAGFRLVINPRLEVYHKHFATRKDVDQTVIKKSSEEFRRQWGRFSGTVYVP